MPWDDAGREQKRGREREREMGTRELRTQSQEATFTNQFMLMIVVYS